MREESKDFNWSSKDIWKRSAKNTAWCVLGCAIFDDLRTFHLKNIGII